MGLGYYPQAYRIWKRKASHDVSLGTYVMFGVGTCIWLLYGLYQRDVAITLSFLPGAFGSWLVIALTLYYRRTKNRS